MLYRGTKDHCIAQFSYNSYVIPLSQVNYITDITGFTLDCCSTLFQDLTDIRSIIKKIKNLGTPKVPKKFCKAYAPPQEY